MVDKYTWKPAIAFLIIALAAGFAIQRSSQNDARLLRDGLIIACERQNDHSVRQNIRTDIMAEVLNAAADAREREAAVAENEDVKEVSLSVAKRYRELVAMLPYANQVDCEEEVPNP